MSAERVEQIPTPSTIVMEFGAHVIQRVKQLEELNDFFSDALPIVTSLER